MLDVKVHDWAVPKNNNLVMYNAWFRKEYPELFGCEIRDTVESCEDCGFCDLKNSKKEKEKKPMFEEKIIWHEITERALTNEEKAEYAERGYADYEIPEYMFSCEMPVDGQEILVATSWGVSQDLCMIDCDECNNLFELETRGDWDGVKAWAAMPQYKGGDSNA